MIYRRREKRVCVYDLNTHMTLVVNWAYYIDANQTRRCTVKEKTKCLVTALQRVSRLCAE